MTLEELYQSLGGDYARAKSTMMTDAFIVKMLTKFHQSDYGSPLFAAAESGDIKAVFEASHALKGVAGNLALDDLYEKASAVCEKTRGQSADAILGLDHEMQDFSATYKKCQNLIADFLKQQ